MAKVKAMGPKTKQMVKIEADRRLDAEQFREQRIFNLKELGKDLIPVYGTIRIGKRTKKSFDEGASVKEKVLGVVITALSAAADITMVGGIAVRGGSLVLKGGSRGVLITSLPTETAKEAQRLLQASQTISIPIRRVKIDVTTKQAAKEGADLITGIARDPKLRKTTIKIEAPASRKGLDDVIRLDNRVQRLTKNLDPKAKANLDKRTEIILRVNRRMTEKEIKDLVARAQAMNVRQITIRSTELPRSVVARLARLVARELKAAKTRAGQLKGTPAQIRQQTRLQADRVKTLTKQLKALTTSERAGGGLLRRAPRADQFVSRDLAGTVKKLDTALTKANVKTRLEAVGFKVPKGKKTPKVEREITLTERPISRGDGGRVTVPAGKGRSGPGGGGGGTAVKTKPTTYFVGTGANRIRVIVFGDGRTVVEPAPIHRPAVDRPGGTPSTRPGEKPGTPSTRPGEKPGVETTTTTPPTTDPTTKPQKPPVEEPTRTPVREPTIDPRKPPVEKEEETTTKTPPGEEEEPIQEPPPGEEITKEQEEIKVPVVGEGEEETKRPPKAGEEEKQQPRTTPAIQPSTGIKQAISTQPKVPPKGASSPTLRVPPVLPRSRREIITTKRTDRTIHPRVVEWQQGIVNTRLDIDTGIRTHRRAKPNGRKPKDTFKVVAFDNTRPVPKDYDMGIVRVSVTAQGVKFKRRAFPRKRKPL